MRLRDLIDAIEKLEGAINGTDRPAYEDLNNRLWEQRNAFNMAATYLIPNSRDEALFLHGLIDEYAEFVEDEPTRESDREDAIEAIARINATLRNYSIGA